MIALVKRGALRAARLSGLAGLVKSSRWRSNRVLVLCYHGVSSFDEHEWDPTLFVSQERFRQRMSMLRDEGCTVLSLDAAITACTQGTLPPRSVVLTFDDGTSDFVDCALPVLQEFGFPATLYLTTYFVDRGVPVPNVAASYLLWKARDAKQLDLNGLFGIDEPQRVATDAERELLLGRLRVWMKSVRTDAKTEAIEALSQRVGFAPGEFAASRRVQIMSAAAVRDLPTDQIQVELHTHRHRVPVDPASFLRELQENDAVIRELRGRAPRHFCYPDGYFRAAMVPVLRRTGILSATTCKSGMLSVRTNPYFVPRFLDSMNVSDERFRAWIAGTASLLPRRT